MFTPARCLYAGRPDPPYDVRLTSCGVQKAVVAWSAGSDNNDPILGYTVYYNTSFDEPDTFTFGTHVSASRRSANVGLQPWTNYTFSVQANNSLGSSERSAFTPGLCVAPPQRPRQNPEDVCSASRRPDQLVITWQVCARLTALVISPWKYSSWPQVIFKSHPDVFVIGVYKIIAYMTSSTPMWTLYKFKVINIWVLRHLVKVAESDSRQDHADGWCGITLANF